MKEYIEREALIKEGWLLQRTVYGNGNATIESKQLKDIPTADVVEVRHGVPDPIDEVYEDTDGNVYRQIVWYECPFCGSDRIAKYCADCGAKMDGGVNDVNL